MRRPLLSPLARIATLVALIGAGGGCGLVPPSPDHEHDVAVPPAADPTQPYLVLKVGERRLYLMDDDPATPLESFPIAVGRTGHETPIGRFHVEEMIEHPEFHKFDPKDRSRVIKHFPPGPKNPLGERWIGFAHGDGWTVGIHGTPQPELLGRAVSGGCVRMRNADVVRIYSRVRLGTPVIVEP
jgi:lipoprotein-anchoring transpeptidase ErfK/SrfK